MRFRSMVSVFAFALIQAIATFASASTIVDVSPNNAGSGGNSFRIGGPNTQVEYMSWTQSGSYTGVDITALVGSIFPDPAFDAYLSTSIGSSAGAALYTATGVNAPGYNSASEFTSITLFSNLTLGAGTYYLTVFSTSTDPGENIRWATGTSVNVGTGVTGGFANAGGQGTPDTTSPWKSTFVSSSSTLGFTVTGTDTAAVPEPSTYLAGLSAIGMLGLFGWRNRK
ncbi:MAG: PEP-CTERM sorting domain-containing protein [Schlesneria sp.]